MATSKKFFRIALVGPATIEMLQEHFEDTIETSGYPFPVLPLLAKELRRRGHYVSVITTANDITRTLQYHGEGISLVVAPSRVRAKHRALDLFAQERKHLARAIAESRPDVVHAHWTYEFALAALEANVAPTLVTARDAPLTVLRMTPDPYRLFRTLLAYRTRLKIRNLTAVSPEFARRWKMQMVYPRPIQVVPNPLPSLTINRGVRSETPIVLGVGDSSRRKNYKTLLRAFPIVLAAFPDAQLRLVGMGLDPEGPIAEWARAQNLQKSVTFVGSVSRATLAQELSSATIFCHPSLEESFGNVLLEALTAGLPVVAGERSGGVPWVLFDGRAALLVDVRRADKIAEGVIAAIRNPSVTVAEGFDLDAELRGRYSLESVADQYLREYSRITAHVPPEETPQRV